MLWPCCHTGDYHFHLSCMQTDISIANFEDMKEVNYAGESWSFQMRPDTSIGCGLSVLCAGIVSALENEKLEAFAKQQNAVIKPYTEKP